MWVAEPGRDFFSSHDKTATLDYEMVRAADPMRSMRARGPNGATEWRAGCSAVVATGLNRSSHVEQDAFALHSAAAAAAGLSQRVSHINCQVNALVVVAPAALAAAVFDAALDTSLAASLSPPPSPPPPSPPKLWLAGSGCSCWCWGWCFQCCSCWSCCCCSAAEKGPGCHRK